MNRKFVGVRHCRYAAARRVRARRMKPGYDGLTGEQEEVRTDHLVSTERRGVLGRGYGLERYYFYYICGAISFRKTSYDNTAFFP